MIPYSNFDLGLLSSLLLTLVSFHPSMHAALALVSLLLLMLVVLVVGMLTSLTFEMLCSWLARTERSSLVVLQALVCRHSM